MYDWQRPFIFLVKERQTKPANPSKGVEFNFGLSITEFSISKAFVQERNLKAHRSELVDLLVKGYVSLKWPCAQKVGMCQAGH